MNYDKKCQILLIGDSSVGKTSLIQRYVNGIFKDEKDVYLPTVGLDFYTKHEIINNMNVEVRLWDTAGQERFKSLTPNYFKNAEGVMLTYDITNMESFENLKYWINSIKTHLGDKNIFIPIIIVGNKLDMEDKRKITKENADKLSKEYNYKYFETSAKTGEGVDDAVRDLVNQILEKSDKFEEERNERNSVKINENQEDNPKKKGCC